MELETVQRISDIQFYGTLAGVAVIGHVAHWLKKASIDQEGNSFHKHFIDQFSSTLACILAGLGAIYTTLDPIVVGAAWKASVIAAFTIGFSADSVANNKFGKSDYE